jgi:tetratricopeptide (TPR) repeat protein
VLRASLQRAIDLAERRLKLDPQDIDARYQVGAAHGLLAAYTSTIEGRIVASIGPARRAYREHERIRTQAPARKDAGLIPGLYAYGVSSLPAPARLLARVAGFSANRARAVRLVEEAAAYPGDAQPKALFSLALIYNRERRHDDALRVIGDLQRRYPRNRLLWLEVASTLSRAERWDEALAAIDRGLEVLQRDDRPRARDEDARWRALKDSISRRARSGS